MKPYLFFVLGLAVSAGAAEAQRLTASTNGINLALSASSNGQRIAITSWSRMDAADTNEFGDVYVFDRAAQSLTLVSLGTNGFTGRGSAEVALISNDGSRVFFDSTAPGLAGDSRVSGNLYGRHLDETNLTAIIPTNLVGTAQLRSLSPDGRFVLYSPDAAAYRFDLNSGENERIFGSFFAMNASDDLNRVAFITSSRGAVVDLTTGSSNVVAANPIISGNGQVVASRTTTSLVIQDLSARSSNSLPIIASALALSADGGIIAYETRGYIGTPPFLNIGYIDRQTLTTNLVTRGNGASTASVVSRDGRFIAFESWASDLVAGDTNETKDVFVYDLRAKTLTRLNAGGGPSFNPFFSGDSRTLFFNNGKNGGGVDVYATALDVDVLWIRKVDVETNGARRLFWVSRTGERYQLEFKKSLNDPDWTPIAGEIASAGAETSTTDGGTESARFYRVRQL